MAVSHKPAAPVAPVPGALVALQSFTGRLGGRLVTYSEGEPVSSSDPAVRKWPDLFGPLAIREQGEPFAVMRPRVEQATAAPGETR